MSEWSRNKVVNLRLAIAVGTLLVDTAIVVGIVILVRVVFSAW